MSIITTLVSIGVGAALATTSIFVGVTALQPAAKQSEAPLVVYGENN